VKNSFGHDAADAQKRRGRREEEIASSREKLILMHLVADKH